MKKSLGSILILLTFFIPAFADNTLANYTLETNKDTAYVKEAVKITFTAHQKDHSDVMFFFLEPQENENYRIKLLHKKTDKIAYHNYKTVFTYLLFPLTPKQLTINFDFTIKTASDKAVAQVFEGSRDNTKWIETTDTKVPLQPLHINVKSLERPVDLVGDFTLEAKVLKRELSAYEAANVTYVLKGRGYNDDNLSILKVIEGVTLFSEKSNAYSKITPEGNVVKTTYRYALVSPKSFIIPEVTIEAYSPRLHHYYTLTTPQEAINITPVDTASLLDNQASPKEDNIDLDFYKNIFLAVLLFGAGFMSAKLSSKIHFKRQKRHYEDIKAAENAQALILVLITSYEQKEVSGYVDQLEDQAYNRGSGSFKKIKNQLLKSKPTQLH